MRHHDRWPSSTVRVFTRLQRENLTPNEQAEALEVLVYERGWSTLQVGQAINRGPMYVSRRLRVFEDDALAPLVLANQLPVSTAEELLVVADVERRSSLAQQAVDEHWERPQVRAAVHDCIAAIQQVSPRLASRIRALSDEVAGIEPGALSIGVRRELLRFLEVARSATSAPG